MKDLDLNALLQMTNETRTAVINYLDSQYKDLIDVQEGMTQEEKDEDFKVLMIGLEQVLQCLGADGYNF